MVNKKFCKVIAGGVAVASLISCSMPADRAKKIEEGLSEKGGVLYKELEGENPRMVTYSLSADSTIVSIVHDLSSAKSDTLVELIKGIEIVEAVPVEDGYLSVFREKKEDGNERYLYIVSIIRNIGNAKERSESRLNVAEGQEQLGATGYVIDREGKKITLSSYSIEPTNVEIYRTVYDFKGNKIVEDPIHINIPQYTNTQPELGSATYLWECQKCGEKRNSAKRPSSFEFTCHGNGEREGFGNSHQWVKLRRVD